MVNSSYISHQWPHPARKQVPESCRDEAPRAESQLCVITVLASDVCTQEVLGYRRISASAQVGLLSALSHMLGTSSELIATASLASLYGSSWYIVHIPTA